MMWQRFAEAVESFGTRVYLNTRVLSLERDGCHKRVIQRSGQLVPISGEHFINSMPITALQPTLTTARWCCRQPKNSIIGISNRGANRWRYRPISRQLIYIHSPQVKVGRIQNFKNWSGSWSKQNVPGNGIFLYQRRRAVDNVRYWTARFGQ